MSRRQPTRILSLEQTLEQERLEILDSLDGHQSPSNDDSPASTRRGSMQLDFSPGLGSVLPRHGSIAGIGVGVTPPSRYYSYNDNNPHRRTWNEPVPSSPLRLSSSAVSTPSLPLFAHEKVEEEEQQKQGKPVGDSETTAAAPSAPPRRSSDGTVRSHERKKSVRKAPKSGVRAPTATATATAKAPASSSPVFNRPQFGTMSSNGSGSDQDALKSAIITTNNPSSSSSSAPTSTAPPQEKQTTEKRPRSAMMSGFDLKVGLPSFARGQDPSRPSTSRTSSLDSRFPSRLARSMSPRNRWHNSNPISLAPSPLKASNSKSISDNKDKVIDMDNAHKHLSETALSKLPGSLSRPGSRRGSYDGGSTISAGDERLEKDMYDSENNPISETSDEEEFDESSSSDGESVRGRKVSVDILPPSDGKGDGDDVGNVTEEKPQSLLTAAEDERQLVESSIHTAQSQEEEQKPTVIHSAKRGPQFLSDPSPQNPAKPVKPQVHPRTSFESTSAANTPFGSEDEAELSDIKRAQKLNIQMSTINNSVRNRSIRTIIRGNYANVLEETEGGRRRRRRYMVTTDLSEESVYALEWTIGTILRDGDTLFAVCAIYEENSGGPSVQIGEGAKAMKDSAAIVGSQTEETAQKSQINNDPSYLPRTILGRFNQGTSSKNSSVDSRAMSKAESERVHAVETISQTCVRLLRKTLLQVRIAVEVIHCKSPKHMITEAIDGLEPTLVIVGARGRSALKGVLLGSFSNYLVTHSSVPVMVARRKLKKQTKKNKTHIRLSNNLTTPKSLAMAKVD